MEFVFALLVVSATWVLRIYTYLLWARFIFDWITVLNRRFRPRGFLLVVVELVFTLTDPPIKMFRKILPPVRIGQIALDLGWMLTMFSCWILIALLGAIRF